MPEVVALSLGKEPSNGRPMVVPKSELLTRQHQLIMQNGKMYDIRSEPKDSDRPQIKGCRQASRDTHVVRAENEQYATDRPMKPWILLTMIIVALLDITFIRNITWRDDIRLFGDTTEKSPNNARAHLNLGRSYHKKGDLEQALREYRIALVLNPVYSEGYNNLATVYANLGLFDQAIAMYAKALSLGPGNYASYSNLGQIYYKKRLFEKATECFTKVVVIMPDNVDAFLNRGLAYARMGEDDRASLDFDQACKMGSSKACEAQEAYRSGDLSTRVSILNALECVQMDVSYDVDK